MKASWHFVFGEPVRSQDSRAERVEVTADVPGDLVWFDGHFDSRPVLPAIALVDEISSLVAGVWPQLTPLRAVVKAKFRRPIYPSARLVLRLERVHDRNRVRFEVDVDRTAVSSGVLEFGQGSGSTP